MTDWQVGDLAVVIGSDSPRAIGGGPKRGSIVRVAWVVEGATWTALVIEGFPAPHRTGGWCAGSFRKIIPDAIEQCEPEFITLLKRSKDKALSNEHATAQPERPTIPAILPNKERP